MRLKNILVSTSQRRIVFYGLMITSLLVLMVYLIFIIPLDNKVKADKPTIISLENELNLLLSTQANSIEKIPRSSELPQALGFIKDYLEVNGVTVEEIVTQLSALETGGFNQALIRIRVNGDRLLIVEIIGEIIQDSDFPLILQEIDIGNKNIEIGLNILYRKN